MKMRKCLIRGFKGSRPWAPTKRMLSVSPANTKTINRINPLSNSNLPASPSTLKAIQRDQTAIERRHWSLKFNIAKLHGLPIPRNTKYLEWIWANCRTLEGISKWLRAIPARSKISGASDLQEEIPRKSTSRFKKLIHTKSIKEATAGKFNLTKFKNKREPDSIKPKIIRGLKSKLEASGNSRNYSLDTQINPIHPIKAKTTKNKSAWWSDRPATSIMRLEISPKSMPLKTSFSKASNQNPKHKKKTISSSLATQIESCSLQKLQMTSCLATSILKRLGRRKRSKDSVERKRRWSWMI